MKTSDLDICPKCGADDYCEYVQYLIFNPAAVHFLVPPGVEQPKSPLESRIAECKCGHEWEVKKP